MAVVSTKRSLSRSFWRREDGDWDYFPNATVYGMGRPSYRVDDATKQMMLNAEKSIRRRLVAFIIPTVFVIFVAGALLAASHQDRVPLHTAAYFLLGGMMAAILAGSTIADRHLSRSLAKVLQNAPLSTEVFSPVRASAALREDRANLLRSPLLRLALLAIAIPLGFAAYAAIPGHPFDALKCGLLSAGILAAFAATFHYRKPS